VELAVDPPGDLGRDPSATSPEHLDFERGLARVLCAVRSLGADIDRLPRSPAELADHIAKLTFEDLDRIRADVREIERIGLLPKRQVRP
jgi:hypothetical protein